MQTQAESAAESARGLAQRLKQDGREQLEARKRSAADRIEEIAHALERAGDQLQSQPRLASYAGQIASGVGSLATRMREGSAEELLDDAREFARRNPGMFILGGFAVGVALARFLKSSSRVPEEGEYPSQLGSSGYGARAAPVETTVESGRVSGGVDNLGASGDTRSGLDGG